MRSFLVLAFLLSATTASAQEFRGSISAGLELAALGPDVQLELGYRNFTVMVGYAPRWLTDDGRVFYKAAEVGVRWSLSSDGAGFAIAAQGWAAAGALDGDSNSYRDTYSVLSVTAHWRWQWRFAFIDVYAGPAIYFDSTRTPNMDDDPNHLIQTSIPAVNLGVSFGTPFSLG